MNIHDLVRYVKGIYCDNRGVRRVSAAQCGRLNTSPKLRVQPHIKISKQNDSTGRRGGSIQGDKLGARRYRCYCRILRSRHGIRHLGKFV